ncbi:uncharacterized protein DEA37_0010497 [Paragonimus westermani]|uniref:Homeobox domain-containing protein n=1 Tax=Paragonimus westermani TaxID=34504 RepID=A0A5J4NXK2_9TREM|nr:uncharacterized protein DEA37_0010497 [Paragonimus westermani]
MRTPASNLAMNCTTEQSQPVVTKKFHLTIRGPLTNLLPGTRLLGETQANTDGQKILDDSESPSDFSLQNRSEPETLELNSEVTTLSHPIPDRLNEEPYLNNGLRTPYLNQLFCAKALFSESTGSLSTSCATDASSYAEPSKQPRWIHSPYPTERIQPNADSQTELVDPLNEHVTRSELNRLYQSIGRTEDPTALATTHSHSVTTVSTNSDATSVQARPSPVYPSLITPGFSNTRPTPYETKSFRATTHRPNFSPYGSGLRHFAPDAGTGFQHYSANSFGYGLDGARRKNATRESTTTLKVWLQEHIKNPYPTKGEKIMLAIITKMTLTQVSTWFANARRRLKKENKMSWPPKSNSNSGAISANKNDVTKVHSGQSPIDHNNHVSSLDGEQPDGLKRTVDDSELDNKNGITSSSAEEAEDDDDDDIDEDTEDENPSNDPGNRLSSQDFTNSSRWNLLTPLLNIDVLLGNSSPHVDVSCTDNSNRRWDTWWALIKKKCTGYISGAPASPEPNWKSRCSQTYRTN